jgi:hypothetical protein
VIQFRERGDEAKVPFLDYRLKWFLELASVWFAAHSCPTLLVTDLDTPGVHIPGSAHYDRRGADLRLPANMDVCLEFANFVNKLFDYGNGKLVVLTGPLDPAGKHNDHIHIQVPKPYRNGGKVAL